MVVTVSCPTCIDSGVNETIRGAFEIVCDAVDIDSVEKISADNPDVLRKCPN